MYINTTTLTQHSESEIRSLNPNTSFGSPFVPPDKYAYVFPAPQPVHSWLQSAREIAPVLTDKGHWEQQWEVVDMFSDYTDAEGVLHTKAEQEALYLESIRKASVPQSVSMRQACIQLELDGLLDDVEAIVATLPKVYQIEWQRASTVQRDNPLVEMVRQQQGMTPEQIDELFVKASAL